MRYHLRLPAGCVLMLLLLMPLPLFSQSAFTSGNITIPAYEKYVMKGLNAAKKEIVYVIEYRVKDDAVSGAKVWEVISAVTYPDYKTNYTIIFRLPDIQPISYTVLYTYKEGSYENTYQLKNESFINNKKDTFFIANSMIILYILRCFPFASDMKEMDIHSFGTKSSGYKMYVKNKGLKHLKMKTLKPPDGSQSGDAYTCEAYELEFGIDMALLSMLIPKTYYYFRNDPQKTFVKFKGALMPGEKASEIELVEYSVQY